MFSVITNDWVRGYDVQLCDTVEYWGYVTESPLCLKDTIEEAWELAARLNSRATGEAFFTVEPVDEWLSNFIRG